MSTNKKQSRSRRLLQGNATKQTVSLSLTPALIDQVDGYAADKGISRSAVIELAITGLLAMNNSPVATTKSASTSDNSLVQPPDCIFASPALGVAIHY